MLVNVILSSRLAIANAFRVDFGHVDQKVSIQSGPQWRFGRWSLNLGFAPRSRPSVGDVVHHISPVTRGGVGFVSQNDFAVATAIK
jgi:hypothetical protein